jgi:hypothetical protein
MELLWSCPQSMQELQAQAVWAKAQFVKFASGTESLLYQMHWKCLQRCITPSKVSYDKHSTSLSACNPPKARGPKVWDAAAIKIDCSLPAMISKHCKRYKMDSEVSNNDPGPATARVIVKNQPFHKITPQVPLNGWISNWNSRLCGWCRALRLGLAAEARAIAALST